MRLARQPGLVWEANPRKGGMQGLSLDQIKVAEPEGSKEEMLGRLLGADAGTVRASAYYRP